MDQPRVPKGDPKGGQWTNKLESQLGLGVLETTAPKSGTPLEELEEMWAGGVADLGAKDAAYAIQNQKGYFDYVGKLKDNLHSKYGNSIPVYRNMSKAQYKSWLNGEDVGPTGWTFRKEVASAWGRLAAHKSKGDRVLVKTSAPIESVIMRGKIEEGEIVLDGDMISAHTLKKVKK